VSIETSVSRDQRSEIRDILWACMCCVSLLLWLVTRSRSNLIVRDAGAGQSACTWVQQEVTSVSAMV
jgi:hypothetical protein